MKKLGILLISSLLVGCSSTKQVMNKDESFNITTTIYPTYLLTKEITKGIDDINLNHLDVDTVGCLHDYSLSTNDMKKIEESNVLIINGANMEESIEKAISKVENKIDSSEGIDLLEYSKEHHEEDENHEGHNHEINSHIWLDVENAIKQSENITNNLIKLDAENEEIYRTNLENFKNELVNLDNRFNKELSNVKNKNIVTFHDSFLYLANAYNLNIVSNIQNDEGIEPNAKEIEEIIKEMKEKNVKSIFVEAQYPQKVTDVIKNETNSNIYNLDSLVIKNEQSYIERMNKNLEILKEALNNE